MLKSLHIDNVTVFPKADLTFSKNLNVIIGENDAGKSHVLNAAYAANLNRQPLNHAATPLFRLRF